MCFYILYGLFILSWLLWHAVSPIAAIWMVARCIAIVYFLLVVASLVGLYCIYSRTSEQRTLWEQAFCPFFRGCPYLRGLLYFDFISSPEC